MGCCRACVAFTIGRGERGCCSCDADDDDDNDDDGDGDGDDDDNDDDDDCGGDDSDDGGAGGRRLERCSATWGKRPLDGEPQRP